MIWIIDKDHLMTISPDEGGTTNRLHGRRPGCDMEMFFKRRDYSQIVDGRNSHRSPRVPKRLCGGQGRVIIVDDMILRESIDMATRS